MAMKTIVFENKYDVMLQQSFGEREVCCNVYFVQVFVDTSTDLI